jgi:DMSO reductase anchor subunit
LLLKLLLLCSLSRRQHKPTHCELLCDCLGNLLHQLLQLEQHVSIHLVLLLLLLGQGILQQLLQYCRKLRALKALQDVG